MKLLYNMSIKSLLLLIMIGAVSVGCKQQNNIGNNTIDDASIKFDPTIQSPISQQQTKYSGTAFEAGDQISVYSAAWADGSTPGVLVADGSKNNVHNAKFQRDDYYFLHQGTEAIGFPANGGKIDIFAIYPYNSVAFTDPTKYGFTIPTDQSDAAKILKADMLFSFEKGIQPRLQPIPLTFKHIMSKLVVKLSMNDAYIATGVSISSVKFNFGTTAELNLNTQVMSTATPTTFADITPTVEVDPANSSYRIITAILPPQTVALERACVEVKMSNNKIHTFSFQTPTFSSNFVLASNTIVNLSLKLIYGSTNAVKTSVSMTDWGTGTNITPSDDIIQQSDNKITCNVNASNQTTAGAVKYARVTTKIGSEGGTRTYELPVTYDAGAKQWLFEFRGVGNRPNVYPFTITKIVFLDASYGNNYTGEYTLSESVTAAGDITLTCPEL